LFCDRWIKKTIRNVTTVVPVLITSCHVSEKPNIGPVAAHTSTIKTARPNAQELPVHSVAWRANRSTMPSRRFLSITFLAYLPAVTCWTMSRQALAQARHSFAQRAMISSPAIFSQAAAHSSQHFAQPSHA
jgi:hypothetical protein